VRLALAWSGGKDSALALHALRTAGRAPSVLLTTVTEGVERISIHGVRRELLHAQAAALGLPVVEVRIPPPCPNEVYEQRMAEALAAPPLDAVDEIAFGDLFLEDVRAYREDDAQLLADLPATVDRCGENGAFHTFVHAGPIFEAPIAVTTGGLVERDGFAYRDIVPA